MRLLLVQRENEKTKFVLVNHENNGNDNGIGKKICPIFFLFAVVRVPPSIHILI